MLYRSKQTHLMIPAGTKVLTRRDQRVGVVLHSPSTPQHAYRIRFPDGVEESFRRSDLTIYKHEQDTLPQTVEQSELLRFVAYRCVVGSTAYGLATASSDLDRRGFYIPPADLHWSLAGVPEQLETEHEEVYWELENSFALHSKPIPTSLSAYIHLWLSKQSPSQHNCSPSAMPSYRSMYIGRTMPTFSRSSRSWNRTCALPVTCDGSMSCTSSACSCRE